MIAASRPYRLVLPIVLIVGGAMMLLANLGTLPEDAGWRLLQLWPLLLMMLGVQLLVPHLVRGAAVPLITLLLLAAIALSGFAYALAGPSTGAAPYTRFESTATMAGETAGTIRIDDAADQIHIRARDIGAQLYQAQIDYVGLAPRFSYTHGNIRISRSSNFVTSWGHARDVVELSVNPAVSWTITIDGAGTAATIDLSKGQLRSFKLNGAGNNVRIVSGAPHGVVRVGVDGVGIGLTARFPAGADYRVTAEGIGTRVDGIAQTPGWSTAPDRYDVTLNGVGGHVIASAGG